MVENENIVEMQETPPVEKKKKNEVTEFVFDVVSVFATAVLAVAVAFTFAFRSVGVVGTSMYPTLDNRDRIILSAYYGEPQYGDIVVACQPSELDENFPESIVKRVIATEGQTVDIDFLNGIVYVDGIALDEPYVAEKTTDREDFKGEITVPEGCVFVMGDNRNNSTDSRDNRVGFIREEYIMGKALYQIEADGIHKIEKPELISK